MELTINQTGVHIGKEHSRILQEDLNGLPHALGRDLCEAHLSLIDLTLTLEVRIPSQLAQALGASQ